MRGAGTVIRHAEGRSGNFWRSLGAKFRFECRTRGVLRNAWTEAEDHDDVLIRWSWRTGRGPARRLKDGAGKRRTRVVYLDDALLGWLDMFYSSHSVSQKLNKTCSLCRVARFSAADLRIGPPQAARCPMPDARCPLPAARCPVPGAHVEQLQWFISAGAVYLTRRGGKLPFVSQLRKVAPGLRFRNRFRNRLRNGRLGDGYKTLVLFTRLCWRVTPTQSGSVGWCLGMGSLWLLLF